MRRRQPVRPTFQTAATASWDGGQSPGQPRRRKRRKAAPVASHTVPEAAMVLARKRAREIGGRVVVRSDGTVLVSNH